jgi:chaperonin GroES
MELRPLQDRVVVQRLDEETKTAGGIIIPDNHTEKPSRGTILAVGTGHRLTDGSIRNLEVKVGDKILFGKYSGTEFKVDGKPVLIMKEDEILGVLQ